MALKNQRYADAIKWKKMADRQWFELSINGHRATIIKSHNQKSTNLVLLMWKKSGVEIFQKEATGYTLARMLNDLTSKRFGVLWRDGDAPQRTWRADKLKEEQRERIARSTRYELKIAKEKRLEARDLLAREKLAGRKLTDRPTSVEETDPHERVAQSEKRAQERVRAAEEERKKKGTKLVLRTRSMLDF